TTVFADSFADRCFNLKSSRGSWTQKTSEKIWGSQGIVQQSIAAALYTTEIAPICQTLPIRLRIE
ncbi:MAG TPA: hypothetical protein VJN01_03260, partial [Xanthomonadales bacterium]|nr:hypothetical protein [Xanthomonadales bacterium]